jgi:uncharacterized protein GlcG (DUF336 family)
MSRTRSYHLACILASAAALGVLPAQAQVSNAPPPPQPTAANAPQNCPVSYDQLKKAVSDAVQKPSGGLPVNEWAVVVNRMGAVCAVAFSGDKPTDQWLGSRAIAIAKANTVNAFSLDSYAISTANLWAPSQPGESLYGAAAANPISPSEIYAGDPSKYGSKDDPIVGKRPGGTIAFGGGLALYDQSKKLVGGLGASGNTSCADHNIAWRMRQALKLDNVSDGPSPDHNDEIVYDVGKDGKSESGWGHPTCGMTAPMVAQEITSGTVKIALPGHAVKPSEPPPSTTGQEPNAPGNSGGMPAWMR